MSPAEPGSDRSAIDCGRRTLLERVVAPPPRLHRPQRPALRARRCAGLLLALLVVACEPAPRPRAAYEGEPLRVVAAGELGDAGAVEGFAVVVVQEGSGEPAAVGDLVRVHYIALLADGSELDSSHGDDPLLLRLGAASEVVDGLAAGLVTMKVGELRRITVPPRLGYRNREGVGVPPRTDLTFLVELVELMPR